MRFKILIIAFFIIFYLTSFLYSNGNFLIPEIVSSTFLTQDLSKPTPDIELFTSEDIKALGISNLPDLLKLVSGLNVYRRNASTAEVSLRGFPSFLNLNPLILIDGMEISENVYDRTYFYNLPVDIHDIDRVEVLKNTTITVNGIQNKCGVINIVTKSPQYLDSNYIYQEIGSKNYNKSSFSFNKYLKGFYFKLNGFYRDIDQNDNSFKIVSSRLLSLDIEKFLSNSKLEIKSSYMKENVNFYENIGIVNLPFYSGIFAEFSNPLKGLNYYNILIDYKIKNFDLNFYYQNYHGEVFLGKPDNSKYFFTNNDFYKIAIRKEINFNNDKLLFGIEGRYRYSYLKTLENMKRTSGNIFLENDFNFYKNFHLNFYLNMDRTKDLGTKFSYKLNFYYQNNDTFFRIGYSKEFKKPLMANQYLSTTVNAKNYNIPILKRLNINNLIVNYRKNKNLFSYKIKSFETVFGKQIKNFTFNYTFFYNILYDIPIFTGKLNIFPLSFNIDTKNFIDLTTYGFNTKFEYNFKKKNKIFFSYYHQRVKNKIIDRFISISPANKFSSGILFFHNKWYGSITADYYSSFLNGEKASDTYTLVNLSLSRKNLFMKNLGTTIYIGNIFNNKHYEAVHSNRLERSINFRLKYDF